MNFHVWSSIADQMLTPLPIMSLQPLKNKKDIFHNQNLTVCMASLQSTNWSRLSSNWSKTWQASPPHLQEDSMAIPPRPYRRTMEKHSRCQGHRPSHQSRPFSTTSRPHNKCRHRTGQSKMGNTLPRLSNMPTPGGNASEPICCGVLIKYYIIDVTFN